MRWFTGQSQFTHYWIGKCVCAKQVVRPGPFDTAFLRGSGQARPKEVPSLFALVTVHCSLGTPWAGHLGSALKSSKSSWVVLTAKQGRTHLKCVMMKKILYFYSIWLYEVSHWAPKPDILQLSSIDENANTYSSEGQYVEDVVFVFCKYFERASWKCPWVQE